MAMDVQKALAFLAESGIELTAEQQASLAEFKSSAMKDSAVEYMDGKLIEEADTTEWVENMFALAEKVSVEVNGANVGRGRGEVHEHSFRFDTPNGTLKVSLTTEPTDD